MGDRQYGNLNGGTGVNFVVESEVVSSQTFHVNVPDKVVQEHQFQWQTTLQPEPGNVFVTSERYIINHGTPDESHWRMELDPNFKDEYGVRYLSAYFKLEKAFRDGTVIPALYGFQLHTNGVDESQDHVRYGGISMFSMEKPAYGFSKFIPFLKLGQPFSDPTNNTEKLSFKTLLTIFSTSTTSLSPAIHTMPVNIPFDTQAPLNLDAWVKHGVDKIPVDSYRINQYTSYFQKYFVSKNQSKQGKEIADLKKEFESRTLLIKILEFCQAGKVEMPVSWDGLISVLKTTAVLNIPQLKALCQKEILARMQVSNMTDVVKLVLDGSLVDEVASPVIWKFMAKHIQALNKDAKFKKLYPTYKEYYERLMLEDDPSGEDASEDEEVNS